MTLCWVDLTNSRSRDQSSPLWRAEVTLSLWRSLVAHWWRWVAWSLLRRRHRRHGNCCVHCGHCPLSSLCTTPSETRAQAGTSGEQRPEQQRKSMKAGAAAALLWWRVWRGGHTLVPVTAPFPLPGGKQLTLLRNLFSLPSSFL